MRRAVSKLLPGKLSRLPADTGGFKMDHNSVEDFYIELDSPHKSWLPGEEVSGQVILILRKDLANISITFSLCGYVKINALPHSKLRPVKHVLFAHTIRIYGPEAASTQPEDFVNGLYKGEHRFPFIVKLPNKKVYTSIDFGKGAIVYCLKAALRPAGAVDSPLPGSPGNDSIFRAKTLSRFHSPSVSSEKIIQLVSPIDVAGLPHPKPKRLIIKDPRRARRLLRVQLSTSTINTASTISSNDSDSTAATPGIPTTSTSSLAHHTSPGTSLTPNVNAIRITMEIAHRGFLRGELIPIKISINHLKKIQDSKGIIVTLVRVCRLDYGPDGFYESFRKDLQQLVIPLFVDPATFSLEINTSLRVPPDAFPTIAGCPMVSFQYFIEVMINLSGKTLIVDGPSEHPKSSFAPHEEKMLTQSQGLSPGNGSNFNFHPYAATQNRSDFINTDKFKRLNKFLQITTEVVIGTFRLEKLSDVASSPRANIPLDARGSTEHLVHSPLQPNTSHDQASRRVPSVINSVPEASPVTDFSIPPYLETTSTMSPNGIEWRSANAPTYDDVAGTVPSPEHMVLTEKERMRQHEASLLPSAPQFDQSDTDDRETVSPVDPTDGILDDLFHQETIQQDESVPGSVSYNFFAAPLPPNAEQPLNEEDDLYEAPDIHEGIGLEGATDFVPNYDTSGNDMLVTAGSNGQTHELH